MRSILLLLFAFAGVFAGGPSGDELHIVSLEGEVYNKMIGKSIPEKLSLTYNYETKSLWLIQRSPTGDYQYKISDKVEAWKIALNKFLEWNEKAKKENVKISKDIGWIPISDAVWNEYDIYRYSYIIKNASPRVNLSFVGTSDGNKFSIGLMGLVDKTNKYAKGRPKLLFLKEKEVKYLIGAISPESLALANLEAKKTQEIASTFK